MDEEKRRERLGGGVSESRERESEPFKSLIGKLVSAPLARSTLKVGKRENGGVKSILIFKV